MNNVIDITTPFRSSGSPNVLALRRDGRLAMFGGTTPPSQATNIAAIAGTSDNGIAMVASGSPVFPGLPANRSVVSGARAYFRALATGALPISYQWRRDGTNIIGATNTVLTLTNAQPTHMGAYTLVASNALGMATNGSMLLTVLPLEITKHPQDRLQYIGGTVSFDVVVEGQGPLQYQWLFNSQPIDNATNATLTLPNLQLGNVGAYSVVVSNAYGQEVSQLAQLTLQPILIANQPKNQTILVNSNMSLSVVALGAAPLFYHWQLNGNPLPNETNATLNLSPAGLANAGVYSVIVSNVYGATNITFSLQVLPTFILARPVNQPVFRNGTAAFSLLVQSLIPVSYTWLFNGSEIPNATNSTLTLSNVQHAQAGTYSIILSNQFEISTNSAWLALVEIAAWGQRSRQTNVPPNATNLMGIAAGYQHYLTLNQQGEIVGWGDNFFQQASHPPGLTNCIAIDAGQNFSVALKSPGEVVAWGSALRTNVPSDFSYAVAIASGNTHSLLLTSEGTVRAWGSNTYGETNVPATLSNVVMISAGQGYSLALKADGTVVAWGENEYGQSIIPAGLSGVVQFAAGGDFNLALKSDGTVVGWGANYYGQTNIPAGLTNVTSIAVGYAHCLALKADGTVTAWGYNAYGQTSIPTGLTNVIAIAAHPSTFDSLAQVGDGPPVQRALMLGTTQNNNSVSFQIPSQSGRVYRLEYTTSIESSDWIPLPLVAGNGKTLSLADPTATNSPQRYYRVSRW